MEVDRTLTEDQNIQQRAKALQSLSTGPIPSSISKITASSRGLPSGKDFDFYCNLDEFKCPVDEIAAKCQAMLTKIGSSKHLWDTEVAFPVDVDDAYDLVVNINDEVLERFDMSGDEFSRKMKAEEEGGIGKSIVDQDGFQLVRGKTKKETGSSEMNAQDGNLASTTVRVAERDKQDVGGNPKVPFHIPTIRKPQDQYNILVNNSNQPFQHVWLQRSEDGSRFIHPLENMSFLDFVDQNIEKVDPMKPPSLASTPFKLVEEVKDLKELAAKLRSASEFSIDLEHNHYRSFQGLTCLMQISTRTEDFVIDTLKLRVQIGPYLREVFKDSTKKKVMHGADWDIMWLQRDFGIYVCNLFDTGQASRVLKLERNSLEYLLHHFCGVTANKEYQKADWRLRPLPHVMIRYAREDTHYLLYIYDLMRIRLMSESTKSEKSDALLVEVYERSYKICSQLYEKELLTDSSYLHVYGVLGANFNARQLGIIAGLCEWRDIVARSEDESTGYILPNKTLLEIAKQMPVTTSMLRRLVKSKHIDRNLGTIVNIIRHAMQNAAAFEPVALQLREAAARAASESNMGGVGECNVLNPSGIPVDESNVSNPSGTSIVDQRLNDTVSGKFESRGEEVRVQIRIGVGGLEYVDENENFGTDTSSSFPKSPGENIVSTKHVCQINASSSILEKAPGASVQVLKKHNQDVGAPPGKLPAKRKVEQNKGNEETKLEQIKSSVSRRFHEFSGTDTETKLVVVEPSKLPAPSAEEGPVGPDACTKLDDNVKYEKSSSNNKKSQVDESGAASERRQNMEDLVVGSASEDDENEPMSLSDLSSSFQIFLKPTEHNQETKRADRSEPSGSLGFKPFDCAAAREQVKFGEPARRESKADGCANKETHSIFMKRSDRRTGIADSSGKDDDTLPSSGKGARGFSC